MNNDVNTMNATFEQLTIEGTNITIRFAAEKNKEAEEQIYKLLSQSIILKLRM